MKCKKCNSDLNINDVKKSKWKNEIETFTICCSNCNEKNNISIDLFKNKHINEHYLNLLLQDSSYNKKIFEKYLDYIPSKNKKNLLKHLDECICCQETLESKRLQAFSKNNEQNQELFKLFNKFSLNIIQEITNKQYKLSKNKNIETFKHENKNYKTSDIIYENVEKNNGIKLTKICYNIIEKNIICGMAMFIITNDKVILDKIWLKNEATLKKEKLFLKNIKNGKEKLKIKDIEKLNFI
jgi:hypothetical protein